MTEVERAIKRVQSAVAAGYPAARLARRAGLAKRSLQHVHQEDWNPLASTLSALIKALDEIEREAELAKHIKPMALVSAA